MSPWYHGNRIYVLQYVFPVLPQVSLPAKHVNLHELVLSEVEQALHDTLFRQSRWEQYLQQYICMYVFYADTSTPVTVAGMQLIFIASTGLY